MPSSARCSDTDVARRQFVTGSFSYERFFSTMGQLLPKLCAPIRDDEVKDLVENKLSQGQLRGQAGGSHGIYRRHAQLTTRITF